MRRDTRAAYEDDFVAHYAARASDLRKTAYLLCGDWHLAEDLTQTMFTKLYRAWHRIERRDALEQVPATQPLSDERVVLRTALGRLPKRRRAVLVLRFWADLSVAEVANILGCATGTVKSQTAAGLADLRRVLGGSLDDLRRPAHRGGEQ